MKPVFIYNKHQIYTHPESKNLWKATDVIKALNITDQDFCFSKWFRQEKIIQQYIKYFIYITYFIRNEKLSLYDLQELKKNIEITYSILSRKKFNGIKGKWVDIGILIFYCYSQNLFYFLLELNSSVVLPEWASNEIKIIMNTPKCFIEMGYLKTMENLTFTF